MTESLDEGRRVTPETGGIIPFGSRPLTGCLATERIRATVFIATPYEVYNDGLSLVLETRYIQVIGSTTNWKEIADSKAANDSDAVLIDTTFPRVNWDLILERLKRDTVRAKVIPYGASFDPMQLSIYRKFGMDYAVLKTDPKDELANTILAAKNGSFYTSPQLAPLFTLSYDPINNKELLTSREIEILRLIATGHTNKEVGDILYLATKTVETHRAHIRYKVGKKTRIELMQAATAYL